MEVQKKNAAALQWHPAFFADIQIELKEDADNLVFENEHQLGTKPMEIDVLVIKKETEQPVQKNIGRIFKKYNIIEYKSPTDYLSVDTFYKVYGYTCFYKADTSHVDGIKIEELTITLIAKGYPRKLIRHLLEKRKYQITNTEPGIYIVDGDIIPIQIIVTSKLSVKENLWLKSLTDELDETETATKLIEEYTANKENTLYRSAMDMIVRANRDKFEEVKDMCDALEELMKDRIEEKANEVAQKMAGSMAIELAAPMAKELAGPMAVELAEQMIGPMVEKSVDEAVGEAIEKYVEITENRMNSLIIKLSDLGRTEDILKAAKDKEYQVKLFNEFHL